MKKFLLTAIFAVLGALVFAQERIAVFPFEDRENILTRNEKFMLYDEFSNEFTNRNAGRFSVVERQDVDRLINTEMDFQLTIFSAQEKTAEMMRVQNATRILSGTIGTLNDENNRRTEIRFTVSLYTYPDLIRLPGGATLSVTNKNELFNKIPELVQQMQNAITEGTAQPISEGPVVSLYDQLVNATGTVTITVTQDAELPSSTVISKASSITLRGDTAGRTIFGMGYYSDNMFWSSYISIEKGVTLILENITLRGVRVNIEKGGTLVMNSLSTITSSNRIGVYVLGTFVMNSGYITNNKESGVYVGFLGKFTMNGGRIENNTNSYESNWNGGGVYNAGEFYMTGGTIANNRTSGNGGGVYTNEIFIKTGGVIYGSNTSSNANIADKGDAVYLWDFWFPMSINRTVGNSYNINHRGRSW